MVNRFPLVIADIPKNQGLSEEPREKDTDSSGIQARK